MKRKKGVNPMNTLLILNFETGDQKYPYDTMYVLTTNNLDSGALEDSFMAFFESDYDEDLDYQDYAEIVLNAEDGLEWKRVTYPFICERIVEVYI